MTDHDYSPLQLSPINQESHNKTPRLFLFPLPLIPSQPSGNASHPSNIESLHPSSFRTHHPLDLHNKLAEEDGHITPEPQQPEDDHTPTETPLLVETLLRNELLPLQDLQTFHQTHSAPNAELEGTTIWNANGTTTEATPSSSTTLQTTSTMQPTTTWTAKEIWTEPVVQYLKRG